MAAEHNLSTSPTTCAKAPEEKTIYYRRLCSACDVFPLHLWLLTSFVTLEALLCTSHVDLAGSTPRRRQQIALRRLRESGRQMRSEITTL